MSTERATPYNREIIAQRDYWVAKLSAERPVSNLILDYDRPDIYKGQYELLEMVLPESTTRELVALSEDSPFLIYATLLAALNVCLCQFTGDSSIVIGSPARRRSDLPSQYPNVLPIITKINGRESFRELLAQVRDALLQAYENQTYPFASLLSDMGLDHIRNQCALFDVALVLKELHCPMPEVRNDITISFMREGGELIGQIAYNSGLFARGSIINFGNRYFQILKQGLQSTSAILYSLAALTKTERRRILIDWNETRRAPGETTTIVLPFEQQVDRAPEATAMAFEGEQVSYLELNRKANQLAHYLKRLGVGPEVIVGIYLNRSVEMIISLLAVLKAGGSYLPMNPRDPKERLSFILSDTRASVVLSDAKLARTLPSHNAKLVRLDADRDVIAQQCVENPPAEALPDNLAYVIYTSGSTGKPKGVKLTHGGLCNLVREQARSFGISARSRVLQFASSSFDASTSEVFVTLLAGATLCLAAQDQLLPGPGLTLLLRENRITSVTLPPSVLLATPKEELPDMETLIAAGEACPGSLVKNWRQKVRFLNAYGPTEVTVCTTIAECVSSERKPSIGRPIANTQVYLLDTLLEPVAIGVPGELHIAGVGLARGYMNRPDLTAEKFFPNPFSDEPGARLYATGDLARFLPDGEIEFLGRLDYQIKLRGFRIEPGEIEETLRQHPNVRDCVVVAREDTPGNNRLVAYVVSGSAGQGEIRSEGLIIAELRGFLQEKLPDYMVPSVFALLEELPLTAHGKIDRKSLPAPRQTRSELSQEYVTPRTQTEVVLAHLWEQALGIKKIGIYDNFFELGGDSLMATEVIFALQNTFQAELPLRILFEAPTVAGLAKAIELATRDGIATSAGVDLKNLEAGSKLNPLSGRDGCCGGPRHDLLSQHLSPTTHIDAAFGEVESLQEP